MNPLVVMADSRPRSDGRRWCGTLLAAGVVAAVLLASALRPLPAAEIDGGKQCLDCHVLGTSADPAAAGKAGLLKATAEFLETAHASLECADCHEGFDGTTVPHRATIEPVDCASCHEKLGKTHGFHPDFLAKPFVATKQTRCTDCHETHGVAARKDPRSRVHSAQLAKTCATCHAEAARQFADSAHATALAAKRSEAPDCLSCHRSKITANQGEPREVKLAQSQLCLSCHLDNPRVAAGSVMGTNFISSYGQSVHGKALTRGEAHAANCVDCHGSHGMNKAMVADSAVNQLHITETCAKCHEQAAHAYAGSVHAAALRLGNLDSPVCTDCHGEHSILIHTDPRAPVAASNLSQQVCGSCHASVKLNERYGLAVDKYRTFQDSYHGLAARGGAAEAVNCASCHGSHEIRHSSDPISAVNKTRLAETCGRCHPGANERFAIGSVHVDEDSDRVDPPVFWVATIYVWLILVVVGGMLVHNAADFLRKIRRKIAVQKGELVSPSLPHRLHLRMTLNERLQHGSLVLSFGVLVLTGFMLRYPDAWWIEAIRRGSPDLFEWRTLLHRVAAIAMLAAGGWHLSYLAGSSRGRQLFRDLRPRWQDVRDAFGVLRYNFGRSPVKPRFGRFSYIEKTEYWALLWGTLIMSATGFFLWFENTSIGLFTKLGYDVSRTVHFYEAILATLAIVVWHFYFVIFNPDVYPMNLAWLTGRISEEEMHEEHPLELARIKAERVDEAAAALPPPEPKPDTPPPSEPLPPSA